MATPAPAAPAGAPVTARERGRRGAEKPVSAEVSITAADEGVLSLIGYQTPDPVPTFDAPWGIGVSSATQLEYLRDIPGPNLERPATGGDAAGTLRSRFVGTAVWKPGAVTNAAGVATVLAAIGFLLIRLVPDVRGKAIFDDEVVAGLTASHSFGELLDIVTFDRGGAPLHFALGHVALLADPSPEALRWLSIVFALATIDVRNSSAIACAQLRSTGETSQRRLT